MIMFSALNINFFFSNVGPSKLIFAKTYPQVLLAAVDLRFIVFICILAFCHPAWSYDKRLQSSNCMSCHESETHDWKQSDHAMASYIHSWPYFFKIMENIKQRLVILIHIKAKPLR
jgi:hypothetical protein